MNLTAGPFIFFGIAILAWYILFVFPQQKQAKERRSVIDSVKAGDEVVTYGGIFAVVKEVQEDWFILTVSDGVDVKAAKEAVVMRRPPADEEAGTDE